MAHIVIYHIQAGGYETGDDVQYQGKARCSGMVAADPDVEWYANVSPSALAATINAAIKDAAIAAALDQQDITVGALDKKTIIGGAVGL